MKKFVPLAAAGGALVLAAFAPQSPSSVLAAHNAAMAKAQGARIVFAVQPIPGVPTEHTLLLGKPGAMRWTSPSQTVATNGETLWVVDNEKKQYTEQPLPEGELAKRLADDAVWVWSGFFGANPFEKVTGVQSGARRNLKGVLVNELSFVTAAPKSIPVTAYVDAKTGLIRGFSMKSGGAETLVIATDLQLADSADASLGSFTPPAGMEKVEKPATTGPVFAEVSPILQAKCLPCHGSLMRNGGLDVTDYAALMRAGRGRVVVPGNSAGSLLIQYVRGQRQPRMPQGGAPLPEEEIAALAAWIDAGAKQ